VISEHHRQQVANANTSERPLLVTTYTLLPNAQVYIDQVLRVFLDEVGLSYIFDQLSFCIRELTVNAKKANTKRVYFESLGLDLASASDYEKGMVHFKRDTLADKGLFLTLLKEHGLYVKVEFLKRHNACSVAVRNNVEIHPVELTRVRDKIAKAQTYMSLEDAFSEVLDESEGAGLGIVVLILMLKTLGFSGDFFQLYTLGGETIARIVLPLTLDDD